MGVCARRFSDTGPASKTNPKLFVSQEEASWEQREGGYSVELFKEGGEGAGQEEIIDRHDNLTIARAIYRGRVSQNPGRLSCCATALALARSDRPETMP